MPGVPVRIGVLGCSSIAERRVLPALARSPRCRLVGVGSRSEDKARAMAARFGCGAYGYEALLDSDIDAVYVSLPPALHHRWGRRALEAGKHLLLDKPFTDSIDTAEDLVGMAAGRSLLAMEALMYVYHPGHERLHRLVTEGDLGALRRVDASFGFPWRPDPDHRHCAELGGGAALDALVYPLSLCLGLLGDGPLRSWWTVTHDADRGIDARGTLVLATADVTASVGYGFGLAYRNEARLWGEAAEATVTPAFSRPSDLAGGIRVVGDGVDRTIPVPAADHFALMLDHFAARVGGEDAPRENEGEDILRRMRMITAVRSGSPP